MQSAGRSQGGHREVARRSQGGRREVAGWSQVGRKAHAFINFDPLAKDNIKRLYKQYEAERAKATDDLKIEDGRWNMED